MKYRDAVKLVDYLSGISYDVGNENSNFRTTDIESVPFSSENLWKISMVTHEDVH